MKKTANIVYKAICAFLFVLGGSISTIAVFSTFNKVLAHLEATGAAENVTYLAAIIATFATLVIVPVCAAIMHEIGMFVLRTTLDFITMKRDH